MLALFITLRIMETVIGFFFAAGGAQSFGEFWSKNDFSGWALSLLFFMLGIWMIIDSLIGYVRIIHSLFN